MLDHSAKRVVGFFGYYATRAAHQQLLAVRTAVEVTEQEKPQEPISQQTENGEWIGIQPCSRCGTY